MSNKLRSTPPTDGPTTMDSPRRSHAVGRPRYGGRASHVITLLMDRPAVWATNTQGLCPRTPGLGSEMAGVLLILQVVTEGLAPNLQGCKAEKRCPAPLENRQYGQAAGARG